ncbi:MAG: DHA2 family efflux MFS transporter permease subunit [Actinomycetota bacterium]|nr:DHA2 family efflux MFS transporter permease subunit [Actinomycetota bacterium]
MTSVTSAPSAAPGRPGAPDGARAWATLAVLCVSLLLVSLDNTVLNVALPTLVRDLHATDTELQWIVDSYAIVFAGLLLVVGSLGDRLGRKWVFQAGLVLFAGGSAASAVSASPGALIAARAFMGVGAAGIMPSTLSILTNVFTDEYRRARAIGIWSGTTGLGIAIGPIVGGWLLDHFWWGSVFLINVPIAVVGLVASVSLVPNSRRPAAPRPDPVGALSSVVGLSLLLWGIIEAPERSWSSPLVLGAIAAGIAVLTGFVLWERRCEHPMLQLEFFANRRFSAAIASMSLVIFALMGALFVLTQYLQFSLGYDAFQTGLRIGPMALVILVVAPASSLLVRLLGTKVVVFAGMAVISVGMAMLCSTTTSGSYMDAFPAFMLLGVGTGLAFAPSTESVMGALPLEQTGVGSATNSTALQVGGALGVAVLGSLLNTRYQDRLVPLLAHQAVPGSVRHLILGSLGGAIGVAQAVGGTLGHALAGAARGAFVSGLDLASLVGALAVAVGALVVAVVLPSRARRGS